MGFKEFFDLITFLGGELLQISISDSFLSHSFTLPLLLLHLTVSHTLT